MRNKSRLIEVLETVNENAVSNSDMIAVILAAFCLRTLRWPNAAVMKIEDRAALSDSPHIRELMDKTLEFWGETTCDC